MSSTSISRFLSSCSFGSNRMPLSCLKFFQCLKHIGKLPRLPIRTSRLKWTYTVKDACCLMSGYSEDNIQKLEPREHIRLRTQMYFGGTGVAALHLLLFEV